MPNKMLIDASHPEETRVVVVHGNRIEEFDFESQDKKQLKGNIYLARVTRVEPSLQAAFVEYGGNRHGFLAFSEIHPDYYQIPVADRQALLRAEAEAAEDEDEDGDSEERRGRSRRRRRGRDRGREDETSASSAEEASAGEDAAAGEDAGESEQPGDDGEPASQEAERASGEVEQALGEAEGGAAGEQGVAGIAEAAASPEQAEGEDGEPSEGRQSIAAAVEADVISEPVETEVVSEAVETETVSEASNSDADEALPRAPAEIEEVADSNGDEEQEIESVGAEDALEEVQSRRRPMRRQYKIQEVIKRRQILLVQVVKEERGNKGAALTTYLSLAGRYSVLMPNTARGGGISRKITNVQDRKRLKEIVQELEVPQGMGVILRTAGESRTKAEIRRDYEYLMRLWENVRTLTLQSTAPTLVYEEGSLIKRSVRDLYNKDIDEIIVCGDEGYREAKDFMRMLMPSHAKVVQPYRDTTPIFVRYGVEAQLDKMLQPQVTLKSGGYLIINQTEALVSIDVNSGRSTREHSIEETALHTNLEAAEEIARQLRLRDLAGLIVIDFIDMEENRNNRAVEKKLKDCLKNDRARIQLGRISHFGLMEMSRQRIRASVLESTMKPCPHCGGTGHVRSDSSVALLVVRGIEEFLLKDSRCHIIVRTPASTAMYVLNHKRSTLTELEARFGLTITIEADETVGPQHFAVVRGAVAEKPLVPLAPATPMMAPEIEDVEVFEEEETEEEATAEREESHRHADDEHRSERRKRKRRRRRGGRDRDRDHAQTHAETAQADQADDAVAASEAAEEEFAGEEGYAGPPAGGEEGERKKRRRGKRGGRRNRGEGEQAADSELVEAHSEEAETADAASVEAETADAESAEAAADLPQVSAELAEPADASASDSEEPAGADTVIADAPIAEAPKRTRRAPTRRKAAAEAEAAPESVSAEAETAAGEKKPARRSRKKAAAEPEAVTAVEAAPPAEEPTSEAAAVSSEGGDGLDSAAEPVAATEAAAQSTAAQPAPASDEAEPAVETNSQRPSQSAPVAAEPAPNRPKKTGWWQRKGFF
ncbi:Rne/Rng family ribonuclease [Pseudaminobacter sp. 19-2017]|uniref:Ribonuclease E n=1 Tax=Pseudaminobacter soli (ex Zhang et al. 2022) TaxID=2831468 RepID=A0A942E1Q7_9HYPH|nr:ribonuclease E/G [Pseudaminobacter soli]MBS3652169.1 Rne/Rng family ribonuclease [Pseudaminobacter soli]